MGNIERCFVVFVSTSIHGSIEMPAFAVAVIDTPQFQRLREIKVKSFL